jgi:hypothetical protein
MSASVSLFVLIPAASSSVGLAAIQIANYAGATTIALTRTSAKKRQLLDAGAAHVIATAETAPTKRDRHLQLIAKRGRMSPQRACLGEADIGLPKRVIGDALAADRRAADDRGSHRSRIPEPYARARTAGVRSPHMKVDTGGCSPLEGGGFELSVPRQMGNGFEALSETGPIGYRRRGLIRAVAGFAEYPD